MSTFVIEFVTYQIACCIARHIAHLCCLVYSLLPLLVDVQVHAPQWGVAPQLLSSTQQAINRCGSREGSGWLAHSQLSLGRVGGLRPPDRLGFGNVYNIFTHMSQIYTVVYVCICLYIDIHIYIYMYIYIHVPCIYIYVLVYIYIYTCVYKYKHLHLSYI